MKNFVSGLVGALLIVAASSAHALTYKWSFEDPAGTVFGTISGLSVGGNDGTGLIIYVLGTPGGEFLGDGWALVGIGEAASAFVVQPDTSISFANAHYAKNDFNLYFGGYSGFGKGSFAPEVSGAVGKGFVEYAEADGKTAFEPLSVTAVPLPAGLPLLLGGVGVLAMVRRRRG